MATHSSVLAWRIPGMGDPSSTLRGKTDLRKHCSCAHGHTHNARAPKPTGTPPAPLPHADPVARPDLFLLRLYQPPSLVPTPELRPMTIHGGPTQNHTGEQERVASRALG